MTIARRMLGPRLAAGLLPPRVGTFESADDYGAHATPQYLAELRMNARHVELMEQGLDWMAARRQAREETERENGGQS